MVSEEIREVSPGPKMYVGPPWETPGGYLLPEFADGWLCDGFSYQEGLEHMSY